MSPLNMLKTCSDKSWCFVCWCFGTHERSRICLRGIIWLALSGLIVWQGWTISTTSRRVRDANERNFRILHGAPVPIVVCDESQTIVEFNREAEAMFGWQASEVLGKSIDILIVPEQREDHRKAFAKAVSLLQAATDDWTVTRTNLSGTALRRDGTELPIIFYTRGIKFGERIEFLATFRKEFPAEPKTLQGPLDLPKKPG